MKQVPWPYQASLISQDIKKLIMTALNNPGPVKYNPVVSEVQDKRVYLYIC